MSIKSLKSSNKSLIRAGRIKLIRGNTKFKKQKQNSKPSHIKGTHSKKAYIFGDDFRLCERTSEQPQIFIFSLATWQLTHEESQQFIRPLFWSVQ
jgi:hypothetical protein